MRAFAAILEVIGRLANPLTMCRCSEDADLAEVQRGFSDSDVECMAFRQKTATEPTLWQGRLASLWSMKPDSRRKEITVANWIFSKLFVKMAQLTLGSCPAYTPWKIPNLTSI